MKIGPIDIAANAGRMVMTLAICALAMGVSGCYRFSRTIDPMLGGTEEQLTFDYKSHYLNSHQCFSPDDKWIVYDTRIAGGSIVSSGVVEKVNVKTGEMIVIYRAPDQGRHGPGAGAAAYNPVGNRMIFARGLLGGSFLRPYGFRRRGGVIVEDSQPQKAIVADARDVTEPFTAGALRGGTYEHTWSGDGKWVSFIYHDAVLGKLEKIRRKRLDLRTIGVSIPSGPVKVDSGSDGENHDGAMFSVLAVWMTPDPKPDSDEIERAYNHSWVGSAGYLKPDGARQRRAVAFQGIVRDDQKHPVAEVFIVDLPDSIDGSDSGGSPAGTASTLPQPPKGCLQRRLTYNTRRKYPGIQGPQHWLRSSADGKWIAYLAKDDDGLAQIHLVSPNGGKSAKLTRNARAVQSAFNWSPDGRYIAYAMDNSVFVTDTREGETFGKSMRLTPRSTDERRPLPHAIVWSNLGDKIAFCRNIKYAGIEFPQVFIVTLGGK